MIKYIFVSIGVLLVLCFNSCADGVGPRNVELQNILVDNLNSATFSNCPDGIIKIIKIKKEAVKEIGYTIEKIAPLNENSILIQDYALSNVSCIDSSGNLLWTINPPSPELDRYVAIGFLTIDHQRKNLYIEDMQKSKVDVYDFDGKHLRTIRRESNVDAVVIAENTLLYDISEISPLAFPENNGSSYRFIVNREGERSSHVPIAYQYEDEFVSVMFYNRFNIVDGAIQHRRPFEDTLFEVSSDLSIKPILTVSFTEGQHYGNFKDNNKYYHPSRYFRENSIARPNIVVKRKNKTYLNYLYGPDDDLYFAAFENGVEIMKPGKYYVADGHAIPAGKHYSQGAFYQNIFQYEYDFLQLAYEHGLSNVEIEKGLDSLDHLHADGDDMYIVSHRIE